MKYTLFNLFLLAAATPAAAQETVVELDPGLWSYTSTVSVAGRGVVHEDSHQRCMSPAEARIDVRQMIAEMLEGDCQQDGFTHTTGSATLNATCRNTEDGTVATGTLAVTYTASDFRGSTDATITGPGGSVQAQTVTVGRRLGDC